MTILLLTLCGFNSHLLSQELTLPTYHLQLDEDDLNALNRNPWSSRRYPATLDFDGNSYDCEVRYRGASGRNLPKKSWKVYFDNFGPHDEIETNLNSEYRDQSFSRNHLAMTLAHLTGLPAPETRFLSLKVNNVFHGVYIEVEQIDEQFFNRRDLNVDALFKCGTKGGYAHAVRFAPPLYYDDFTQIYEPKFGNASAIDELGKFIDFVNYSTEETFAEEIEERIDVSDILKFFAVQYTVANTDGVTKNIYIAQDSDGRYILLPWDCDASFGNAIDGNYVGNAHVIRLGWLEIQGLFQRLIENPERQDEMIAMVDEIISDGFDSLADSVEAVWDLIRHDVLLDTFRFVNGDRFDYEEGLILRFMADRAEALADLDYFRHIGISRIYPDVEYLADPADSVTLYADLEVEADEVRLAIAEGEGRIVQAQMWDNGLNGDEQEDDLTYSVRLSLEQYTSPFYYCCYVVGQIGELYPLPYAAWHMFRLYHLSLPSFRVDSLPPEPDDVEITSVHYNEESDSYYFGLINSADHPINLSGCVVRIGDEYRRLTLTELPTLEEDDTLYVTNHAEWIKAILPNRNVTGELHFVPVADDTLTLKTSSGRLLATAVVDEIHDFEEFVGEIVINEINYHSSNNFNPDDWIELYCRFGDHDLSGWSICDSNRDNRYVFPEGIDIQEGGFLIIAQDPARFSRLFPNIEPLIGGFDFGFSADGDAICLLDSNSSAVDWVRYDDSPPWAPEADGEGATLELTSPDLPNYGAEFWRASQEPFPHGTPGRANVARIDNSNDRPVLADRWQIEALYPIPFNNQVHIKYSAPTAGRINFSIVDITGRKIISLFHQSDRSGCGTISWDGRNRDGVAVASGMYFIGISDHSASWKRLVLIR